MRVLLNAHAGIKNMPQKQVWAQKPQYFRAVQNNQDTITFSSTKPIKTVRQEHFDNIDRLLSEAEHSSEQVNNSAVQIVAEIGKIIKSEETSTAKLAEGIKERINTKTEFAKQLVFGGEERIIVEQDQGGRITRKITFKNGFLSSIEEDGPFDTKNITTFEKGVLKEYKEGFQEFENGETSAEMIISYWPNGNVSRYVKNQREQWLDEQFEKEILFDPKGKIVLYRENCTLQRYMLKSCGKYIRSRKSELLYMENFKRDADSKNSTVRAEIKYKHKKPFYIKLGDKVYMSATL